MPIHTESDILSILTRPFKKWAQDALDFVDDAALLPVVPRGFRLVVSQDMLVENVDFRTSTFSPADIASKALAVNLSDMAAMGARPLGFTQSLALPSWVQETWLAAYAEAGAKMADLYHLSLLGGDLSRTDGPLVVQITIFGEVKEENLLRRLQAEPGDRILVSGPLGQAHAGLLLLEKLIRGEDSPEKQACIYAQKRPTPAVELGMFLGSFQKNLGSRRLSVMDVSDGLSSDLPRLIGPTHGAILQAMALPIHPWVRSYSNTHFLPIWKWAVHGGEDYGLLVTCPEIAVNELLAQTKKEGHLLTVIGEVTLSLGYFIQNGDNLIPLTPHGFDHFTSQK